MATNPFRRLEEHLIRLPGLPVATRRRGRSVIERLFGRATAPSARLLTRPPASESELAGFEQRFDVRLPDDVVRSYLHMNGSDDYTNHEAGWIRFWPIEEWKPVAEEFPTEPMLAAGPLADSFACADQGLFAFVFALDLDPDRHGRVYVILPDGVSTVSWCFTEFVNKALDASPDIYGA